MAQEKAPAKKTSMFPILLASFIDMVGIGIIIPVLAPLIINNDTGIVPGDFSIAERNIIFGLLTASFPLAQFFGSPILGALSDKYGRKPMLTISMTGSMIGYFLFAYGILTNDLYLAFGARILDGFTGGNISIIFSSIADLSNPEKRAQNFGLVGVMFGIGFIMGPFIGGLLASEEFGPMFGPALPFWVAGALCGVNVLFIIWLFRETLLTPVTGRVNVLSGFLNIGKALSMRNLRAMFITIFLHTLGFSFFTTFFSVLMIQKFGLEEQDLGYMFGFVGVCLVITQGLLIKPLNKRFKSYQVLRFSLLGLALTLAVDIFPDAVWMIYAILPFMSVSQGLTSPNMNALVSNEATPEQQGEIMGINNSIASIGIAIPPLVAGFLTNLDPRLPTIAAAAFVFLAWVTFIVLFRPSTRTSP